MELLYEWAALSQSIVHIDLCFSESESSLFKKYDYLLLSIKEEFLVGASSIQLIPIHSNRCKTGFYSKKIKLKEFKIAIWIKPDDGQARP
jgi:hypothetical protein